MERPVLFINDLLNVNGGRITSIKITLLIGIPRILRFFTYFPSGVTLQFSRERILLKNLRICRASSTVSAYYEIE